MPMIIKIGIIALIVVAATGIAIIASNSQPFP